MTFMQSIDYRRYSPSLTVIVKPASILVGVPKHNPAKMPKIAQWSSIRSLTWSLESCLVIIGFAVTFGHARVIDIEQFHKELHSTVLAA